MRTFKNITDVPLMFPNIPVMHPGQTVEVDDVRAERLALSPLVEEVKAAPAPSPSSSKRKQDRDEE